MGTIDKTCNRLYKGNLYEKKFLRNFQGLSYLHSMGIIHRDIKSLNFLVDKYWIIKVCGTWENYSEILWFHNLDFGQSRHIDYEETMTGNRGTLQW